MKDHEVSFRIQSLLKDFNNRDSKKQGSISLDEALTFLKEITNIN
jgi:hypothetical protein